MELKNLILCLATVLLLATSLVYGVKFLRKRNYLLGVEWLVVTLSTSNLLIFLLSGAQIPYAISHFCDAFSRGFGIPVIGTLGLMAVTHRYRPSKLVDVLIFAGSAAGTAVLVYSDAVAGPLPYFYVLMWTVFSLYMMYFAYRLLRAGEQRHALIVIVGLVAGEAIACIYDFYRIPGDNDMAIFFTLALTTWAFNIVEMYYAYGALERAETA
ncbi:hypothetical protein NX786_14370 [Telluria mixta]|uniref:Uncharacterized protein n=1 Tax=Telluria mixta TaxID=34071 RepID=A0ABT2BZG0_9BURK|nr:hypothetical protein [Telluria mixta]MCS0630521.1 hypothetical protein [Telluria mixta]WEM94174.1 hypothetical protein P0M04_22125 [Telluria mixta]